MFDQRFALDGLLSTLKQQSIQIHTRSTFLQGLLLMNPETVNHYFDPWVNYLTEWHRFCKKNKFQPLEIALSFVNSFPEVDRCIVGVQSMSQLQEITSAFRKDTRSIDFSKFAIKDEYLSIPPSGTFCNEYFKARHCWDFGWEWTSLFLVSNF